MKNNPDLERVFPLSGGSAQRPTLRPPRLATLVKIVPGVVLINRAFVHPWSGRRAGVGDLALTRTV